MYFHKYFSVREGVSGLILRMGQKWEKFLLLSWKNWLLQWRRPVQTLIEILAPVVFCALLVLIRSLVDPEPMDSVTFAPFSLNNSFLPSNVSAIFWSPCGNPSLTRIMARVSSKYRMLQQCFTDSSTLDTALQRYTAITFAGVQFSDSLAGRDDLDPNTRVILRFPGELRYSGSLFGNWMTHLLFPLYQIPGPRFPNSNLGATPRYFREGFLGLQNDLAKEILNIHNAEESPEIMMCRFPYPAWIDDPLLTALQSFVSIIFMLSFVYSCINTVKVITTEKEKQLKEAMKIMGLPNWLHWTAWFVKVFFFLLISVILMVILLKVPWYPDTDFTVFTLADPFVLFLFLVFYICATITFCFAVSVFFSKANTAATIAGLAWFLSYFPYIFLQEQYNSLTLTQKLLSCLGHNSAMAYGFQLILMYEGTGEGLTWSNIFSPVTPDDSLSLGLVMMMLLIDTFIYLIIALYVEAILPGDYGIPQVWYFPFTRTFWCGEPQYIGVEDSNKNVLLESDVYEKEPNNLVAGVKISHLRKQFTKHKVAVRDLSLNMFEGQITVLLGHNGAGKTTTMSMLTGMLPPTSGTAIINGYDIRTNMKMVRDSLGLCPQHNILFDDLTVREHLYFFCKLKGMRGAEIKVEIQKYIELLELVPKKNAKSSTLSGGMKRKLCVAIALCGKSKVCMFDEPTAGMDPSARRALWDIMQSQKKGRTILLSTHFMDEADLLGDRIAIMAGGSLQCCGSSFFLKKKYGAGYHLVIAKSQRCDVEKVTNLLKHHIPAIEVENNVGSELTYVLSEEQSAVFEEMLSDLEDNSFKLGIDSYGISLTTMEEVFMKVGADHGQEEENDHIEMLHHNGNTFKEQNGHTFKEKNGHVADSKPRSSETKLNIQENEFLTGWPLWRNHVSAMLMKKVLSTVRSWILFIIQNIIPVAFLIIAIIVARQMNASNDLPNLEITLDSYDNPVTVMTTDNISNNFFGQYREILEIEDREYINWGIRSMHDNMLNTTIENTARVRMRYIIGATFSSENNTITAWFNNEPYHSPPLTLQYAINSIVKERLGLNYSILFNNFPLPFTIDTQFARLAQGNNMGFQLAFNIAFSMSFVSSFYILFYVRERVNKSKHLQFVSGARVSSFWLIAFIWDYITFIFTALCLVITLACFQEDGFKTAIELGRMLAILMFFGFSMLPMTYIASFFFTIPSSGYTRMTLINIFLGVAGFMVVQVLSVEDLDLTHIANGLHWGFLLVPHYALATAIHRVSMLFSIQNLCNTVNELGDSLLDNITGLPDMDNVDYACMLQPEQCCVIEQNYFSWTNGIGRNVIFMAGVGIALFVILLSFEYRVFDRIIYYFKRQIETKPTDEGTDDSDVMEEKRRVRAGEISFKDHCVLLKDVTKYYGKVLAVNQLCLGIKEYECFGLLGINGAGKTTTFKMMTGDVKISYGDGWINGMNLKREMKKVHKHIGYCPQFDALLDDLTGKETLVMYCLLRGIRLKDSWHIAEQLAKDFDFYRHLNKQVKNYSGGNKRKLSAALALIGDPAIIFLDEPTTGMDPATKRNLWDTLCKIRNSGKCLILTSHSMEECEALCTRLAIMVNGTFKCLGSTQHLKSKFSEGYMLTIKIKKAHSVTPEIGADMEAIEHLVKSNFPSAIPKESHQELVTYFIPDATLPWSRMFGIMEKGKKSIDVIEDYSLGQSSLEQVFLLFTKQQKE
ncbi:hypothetical protein Trydic_g16721 [Trypoxylus dichotomus]